MSLQEKAREKVARMLRFNAAEAPAGGSTQWKLLVLDEQSRDAICPLYSVGGLRKQGVTLHLMLSGAREAIPDVPAIYLCRPSDENIERVAEDCAKSLYTKMHLNFSTRLLRPTMESLARRCLESNSVGAIHTLYDAYLDFVALEPQLFTLNQKETFYGYNSSAGGDAAIEAMMRRTAESLFTVFATLGQVPVIRAPMGGPAQMVAQLLHEALAAHLRGTGGGGGGAGSLFAESGLESYARPLVVIYDRSVDIATPLVHAATYQGIVADVTSYRLNRCACVGTDGRQRTYDLDVEADAFWRQQKGESFPDAIDASGRVLSDVQAREAVLRRQTATGEAPAPAAQAQAPDSNGGGGASLNVLVDSLPELMEKKKLLESHTNIMDICMGVLSSRGIPDFMDMESDIEKYSAQDLIKFFEKGTGLLVDRVRLAAVWLCSGREISREDYDLVLNNLCANPDASDAKADGASGNPRGAIPMDAETARKALSWLRRFMSVGGFSGGMGGAGGGAESAAAEFLGNLLSRGKQMLGSVKKYKTTNLVEAAVQGGSGLGLGMVHLDPKVRGSVPPAQQQAPHEGKVVAFCIGPGCYGEYQNMVDSLGTKITYGCSELASPDDFMRQLDRLGAEM
uniref:Sec1 family domain-containing protein 1 n=1 Tax=Phaeomonas parva TaxID=124430 RepID=A0A7S1TXX2_9STRA